MWFIPSTFDLRFESLTYLPGFLRRVVRHLSPQETPLGMLPQFLVHLVLAEICKAYLITDIHDDLIEVTSTHLLLQRRELTNGQHRHNKRIRTQIRDGPAQSQSILQPTCNDRSSAASNTGRNVLRPPAGSSRHSFPPRWAVPSSPTFTSFHHDTLCSLQIWPYLLLQLLAHRTN